MNKNISLILLILIFIYVELWKIAKKIRVCICTVGKLENLYIREYISHYLNYGVDKIIIYDNNDINGEKFDNIINDYIVNKTVEIINFRGRRKPQLKAYQHCLNNKNSFYDWLIFYDIDEFIFLKGFKSIKSFLNQNKFSKCQTIQLNMYFHTDNNLLYYDNRTLFERFKKKHKNKFGTLKTIIKGNININIYCVHNINNDLKSCNGFGQFNNEERDAIFTKKPDYNYYYIDHFCFKSTEEFVIKLNDKGCAFNGKLNSTKIKKIDWYFNANEITTKKIEYI